MQRHFEFHVVQQKQQFTLFTLQSGSIKYFVSFGGRLFFQIGMRFENKIKDDRNLCCRHKIKFMLKEAW